MSRGLWMFIGLVCLSGCGRIEIAFPAARQSGAAEPDGPQQTLAQVPNASPNQLPPPLQAPGTRVGQPTVPTVGAPAAATLEKPIELPMPVAVMLQPNIVQWSEREAALDSLSRIGEPAVPALIEALAHRDAHRRREAARALSRIGPEAKEAVSALILATQDEDEGVRFLAIRALGQIGPAAKDAVPTLIRKLNSP